MRRAAPRSTARRTVRPAPRRRAGAASDWTRFPAALRARAARVRLVAFDSDGTLTDGGMAWSGDGREWRRFHVRDGLAMQWAARAGLGVVVVSGRSSEAAAARFADLGVEGHQGVQDKVALLAGLCAARGLEPAQVAFLGDDLPDLAALRWCGLPLAVGDAHPRVRRVAAWIASAAGGHGAARQALEAILDATGHWPAVLARYGEPA